MIPVIDLFAGPGGLGEGFSSLVDSDNNPIFQIVMSVEKDSEAHKTLRLRSYVRKLYAFYGKLPSEYVEYMRFHEDKSFERLTALKPELWEAASEEALCAELVDGDDALVEEGRSRLTDFGDGEIPEWVLIGGPPCQAYSLVGRARRTNDVTLEDDVKQTLYKCYLAFIRALRPTVFVMENVKGLLSAQNKGHGMFSLICSDMEEAGYEIRSVVTDDPQSPKDYVVKSERYGIPQKRHRVILLGVRKGCNLPSGVLTPSAKITLREALDGIPGIRSGFSARNHEWQDMDWAEYVAGAADRLLETEEGMELEPILRRIESEDLPLDCRSNRVDKCGGRYGEWYRGRLEGTNLLTNHESRTHLASDLDRYLFCAAYAERYGVAAHIEDFPRELYPNHKNVQDVPEGETMKFADRFRVQVWDEPSTTITSHISKDGHYYIHPDPKQCRSLTVREVARLQTFPDDYLFEGNRTSQYTQVGNAVPPLLAQQIAKVVADFLGIGGHGFCDRLVPKDDCESVTADRGTPSPQASPSVSRG